MTVFKRPNGRWVAQVHNPATGRPRQLGTFDRKADAKRAESAAVSTVAAGGSETVASFQARWTRDYPRPRESTNLHNAERTKRFAATHGRKRLDAVTVDVARRWCIERPSDLSALRAMFSDARRDGKLVVNPFSGLNLPKRKHKRRDIQPDWLTAGQVDELAEHGLRSHGVDGYGAVMRAMVVFAAYTGVRPGELFALEHDDLDGADLHVRRAADSKTRTVGPTKNGLQRTVVLPRLARDAVASMPRLQGVDRVFYAPAGGQLWLPHFSTLWKPVKTLFGRPDMDFYELRHFCATHLLDLGLTASEVAVQLGHQDNGALVLKTYGHPSERAARARIRAALDGHDQGDLADLRRRRAS